MKRERGHGTLKREITETEALKKKGGDLNRKRRNRTMQRKRGGGEIITLRMFLKR